MKGRESDFGASLTFDRSVPGRRAVDVPHWNGPEAELPPEHFLRKSTLLPEMSQGALVRYYTELSSRNFSVDSGPYPLGSCTMKYNPKVNDEVALLPGFARLHPFEAPAAVQGTLAVYSQLQNALGELTGLPAVSLAPAAGAQGELASILMIKKALIEQGEIESRRRVLVPDSAHGTNPATAAMAGFQVTQIPTGSDGSMDSAVLKEELDTSVAALMVTLPNTLGLWESGIEEVADLVHSRGAFLFGDGANLNAVVGRVRFGDLGFDVMQLNLHKTFATPHGGGGPASGPVCASRALASFLPAPVAVHNDSGDIVFERPERSIGQLQQYHGCAPVLIRALAYIRSLGLDGLRAVSENAVLNANYLQALVRGSYELPFDRPVSHEVVFSGSRQRRDHGVRTLDIVKRLIDYGFHPPTVYFPLIVDEALMFEPTETESREDIEALAAALNSIASEAAANPELLHSAPHDTPVGRLDETAAARRPKLHWALEAPPD